jgi:hypothetical protein
MEDMSEKVFNRSDVDYLLDLANRLENGLYRTNPQWICDLAERVDATVTLQLEMLEVLEKAQPTVDSMACPSTWKTGEPQPHSDECKKMREVIAKVKGVGDENL